MVEPYVLLKFLHVAAVIIWIGGVSALTVITARITRQQERAVLVALLGQTGFYGRAIIGPAGILTLIAGMATAGRAGISFGTLWITWGFIGLIASLLLGVIFMRPVNGELSRLAPTAALDDPRLSTLRQRLTLLNVLNLLILLSVVWAMVAKPSL